MEAKSIKLKISKSDSDVNNLLKKFSGSLTEKTKLAGHASFINWFVAYTHHHC